MVNIEAAIGVLVCKPYDVRNGFESSVMYVYLQKSEWCMI